MNLFSKISISLVIALLVATVYASLQTNNGSLLPLQLVDPATALAFVLCAVLCVFAGNMGSSPTKVADSAASGREQGEVKWFNANKGFGFITRDQGGDVFVHFRSIRGEGRRGLKDGQRVEYEVVDSSKGPQAEDVFPV